MLGVIRAEASLRNALAPLEHRATFFHRADVLGGAQRRPYCPRCIKLQYCRLRRHSSSILSCCRTSGEYLGCRAVFFATVLYSMAWVSVPAVVKHRTASNRCVFAALPSGPLVAPLPFELPGAYRPAAGLGGGLEERGMHLRCYGCGGSRWRSTRSSLVLGRRPLARPCNGPPPPSPPPGG